MANDKFASIPFRIVSSLWRPVSWLADKFRGDEVVTDVSLSTPFKVDTIYGTFVVRRCRREFSHLRGRSKRWFNGYSVVEYPVGDLAIKLEALGGFIKGETPEEAVMTLHALAKLLSDFEAVQSDKIEV